MVPLSKDYYELLGIHPRTSAEDLRRTWRRLALQWHPDHAGPEAAPTFRALAAAYAVLSDPASRAAYDRARPAPRAATTAVASPGAGASETRARAPSVMLSRLTGSLDSLMARGIAQRSGPNLFDLHLDAEEAAQGGMVMISMRIVLHCPDCTGAAPARPILAEACARCGGSHKQHELFSAWLAIAPGIAEGSLIAPSVVLPGTIDTPQFRIRVTEP